MKNIIKESYKHLLYKDEINDTFLLTMYLEIFRKSRFILCCYCWSPKTYFKLKEMIVVFNENYTDDRLHVFETNIENLDILIQCGAQKRRVYRQGRWIKNKERRLAHKIIPFNPSSFHNNNNTLQPERRTS